jgi:glycosyltransferase involved in cell wall biosynthesis
VVLTVRNLEARMGLDTLLHAMVRARATVPDALLVVGGEGSLREPLTRLAGALHLGDGVRLVGRIPEATLAAHYQAADLFVLPTRALEGFGLVAAEALACGTPVLGTAVGAIPEVLEGLGDDWLVPHDAAALGAALGGALVRCRRDADGWEALRRRCRAHALTRLSWDAATDGIERALRALPAGAPRAGALA